jgi:6-phosphogluconolactonase (cycloisomerase 2 family)
MSSKRIGKLLGSARTSSNSTYTSSLLTLNDVAELKNSLSYQGGNSPMTGTFLAGEGALLEFLDVSASDFGYFDTYGNQDVFMGDSGRKLYTLSDDGDCITEYHCLTTGSTRQMVLSNRIVLTEIFSDDYQETQPRSMTFKPDGTKMYIAGDTSSDFLHEFDLSTAWDISTATYVQRKDMYRIYSMQWSTDGTKLFVAYPDANYRVRMYEASTAWDISTLTDSTNKISVPAEDNTNIYVSTFRFNPDGTRVWLQNYNYTQVLEYSLSIAWDITTTAFVKSYRIPEDYSSFTYWTFNHDGTSWIATDTARLIERKFGTAYDFDTIYTRSDSNYSLVLGTNARFGGTLSSDGTKYYVVHNSSSDTYYSAIFMFDMSTPYDPTTLRFTGKILNPLVDSFVDYINFVQFKDDGTKVYFGSYWNEYIYAMDLSTAWDISTATWNDEKFSVASQETAIYDIYFKSDGLTMYVIGDTGNDINQYTLTTAWDISTASYTAVSPTNYGDDQPRSFTFKSDGTYVYVLDEADLLYQVPLTTAWDITTLDSANKTSITTRYQVGTTSYLDERYPRAVDFKSDGTQMFIMGDYRDNLVKYNLSTAWDISTASIDVVDRTGTYATSSENPYVFASGIDTNPECTILYIGEDVKDKVLQYNLASNTNIRSATSVYELDISAETTNIESLELSTDGTKLYIMQNGASMYMYNLSTAWDIRTATYSGTSYDPGGNNRGFTFNSDGTKLVFIDDNDYIRLYNLSTAWDISTASYDTGNELLLSNLNRRDIHFKPDGTKVYYTLLDHECLIQRNLATAWDLTTAEPDFYVIRQEMHHAFVTMGIKLSSDGTKVYALYGNTGNETFAQNNDRVIVYNLTTPWDIRTIEERNSYTQRYHPKNTGGWVGIEKINDEQFTWVTSNGQSWNLNRDNRKTRTGFRFEEYSDLRTESVGLYGLRYGDGGSKMYTLDEALFCFHYYTLDTNYSPESRQYQYSVEFSRLGFGSDELRDFMFKSDGTVLWVMNNTEDKIYKFNLTTAWDISTIQWTGDFMPTNPSGVTGESTPLCFDISSDGSYVIVGGTTNLMFTIQLQTPYDITTYDTNSSTTVSGLARDVYYVMFLDSKTIVWGGGDIIEVQTLKTPYDLTTIVTTQHGNDWNNYTQAFTIASNPNYQTIFFQTDDREQYFILAETNLSEHIQATTPGDYSTLTSLSNGTPPTYPTSGAIWYTGMRSSSNRQWYNAKALFTHKNYDEDLSRGFAAIAFTAGPPDRTAYSHVNIQYGISACNINAGIDATPGSIVSLRDVELNQGITEIRGISWKRDGTILFVTTNEGYMRAIECFVPWTLSALNGWTNYPLTGTNTYGYYTGGSYCPIHRTNLAYYDFGNTTVKDFDFNDEGNECAILFGNDEKKIFIYYLTTPWDINTMSYTGYSIVCDNPLSNSVCWRDKNIWVADEDHKNGGNPIRHFRWEDKILRASVPVSFNVGANAEYNFAGGVNQFVLDFDIANDDKNILALDYDEVSAIGDRGSVSISGTTATVSANTDAGFSGRGFFDLKFKVTEQPMNRTAIDSTTARFFYGTKGSLYAAAYADFTGGNIVEYTGGTNIDSAIIALNHGDVLLLPPGSYTAGSLALYYNGRSPASNGPDFRADSIFKERNILICGDTDDAADVLITYNHDQHSTNPTNKPIWAHYHDQSVAPTQGQQLAFLSFKRTVASTSNDTSMALMNGSNIVYYSYSSRGSSYSQPQLDCFGKAVNVYFDFNGSILRWSSTTGANSRVDYSRCTFAGFTNFVTNEPVADYSKAHIKNCLFTNIYRLVGSVTGRNSARATVNTTNRTYVYDNYVQSGHLYIPLNFTDDASF